VQSVVVVYLAVDDCVDASVVAADGLVTRRGQIVDGESVVGEAWFCKGRASNLSPRDRDRMGI